MCHQIYQEVSLGNLVHAYVKLIIPELSGCLFVWRMTSLKVYD
jgi:hypothetical protein